MDLKLFVKDNFNIFDAIITLCALLEIIVASVLFK